SAPVVSPRPAPAPSVSAPIPAPEPSTIVVTQPEPPAAAAPAESSLSREATLLGRALKALRRDRDPAAALRALDEYRASFPGGTLAVEARVARVDALLLLKRRPEA